MTSIVNFLQSIPGVIMTSLVDFLRSIPDVMWSGVVASFMTLSGVLISNWSNTTRLRIQLQHDADQKASERTSALRREVYLVAAEELTKANSQLAALPQSDLTKVNAAECLQGFFAAAAKLQLVAEPKTALLVNALVASYGELFIRLLQRIIPLQQARADISINDNLYNKSSAEVARILGEMTKFNESAQINPPVFSVLRNAVDFHQRQVEEYAAARSAAWSEFNQLNADFCRQLLLDMRTIGEQQIPVLIEIRRDLGLTSELSAFRAQMDDQWNQMKHQFDTLLSALENDQPSVEGTSCAKK